MKGLNDEIDRLYQLPLEQFTAERNQLAKRAGSDAARVRELAKPSVPAWAVNQLYWQDRDEWDALIASAENLRRAHKAVLGGRSGDVRAAGKVHDDAVEAALKATVALLEKSSHPVTDATRQGIVNTLRALPADGVEAGRLAKTLQPGGFEMLAGLTIAGGGKASPARAPQRSAAPPQGKSRTRESHARPDARAMADARQEVASSERALHEAEQAVRREEFESARASRDERRAAEAVEKARVALDEARAAVERAETAYKKATLERESAERRVPEARAQVATAQKRAHAAAAALRKLTGGH